MFESVRGMKARRESFRKWIVLQNYSPPTLKNHHGNIHHNFEKLFCSSK
jgi:hypothetical protein